MSGRPCPRRYLADASGARQPIDEERRPDRRALRMRCVRRERDRSAQSSADAGSATLAMSSRARSPSGSDYGSPTGPCASSENERLHELRVTERSPSRASNAGRAQPSAADRRTEGATGSAPLTRYERGTGSLASCSAECASSAVDAVRVGVASEPRRACCRRGRARVAAVASSNARYASTRAVAPSSAASASRTGTKRPTKIGVSRSV